MFGYRITAAISICLLILVSYGSGAQVTCASCQGTAGSQCDESPDEVPYTVQCDGKCVTWRSIYSTGRRLRTIWRGCENTLFPTVLTDNFKDTCGFGNHFVECTRTCRGHMCNKLHTGIPECWSCTGDYQSCDLAPPTNCENPEITTTPQPPPNTIECVVCQGNKGEMCDVSPFRATDVVRCNDTCVTWKKLLVSDRSLVSVWRGCTDTLFAQHSPILQSAALDSCHSADNWWVDCTSTCSDPKCNKYSTGFTDCWTSEGRRKPTCQVEEVTTPSRFELGDGDYSTPYANAVSDDDLPVGTFLNCTSCQGVAGEPCDVSPNTISRIVSCSGTCITYRSLHADSRRLKNVWRGCNETLFPVILDKRFRNTCQTGNLFLDCTRDCRTGDRCNQNFTGIPQCWDCHGNNRSCDTQQEDICEDPVEVTTKRPPRDIQCVSCSGASGGKCDARSYSVTNYVPCTSSCVTVKRLLNSTRSVSQVWRGCEDSLDVSPEELNVCKLRDATTHINCITACYDPLCNKYSTGFPECWNEEGDYECHDTTTTQSTRPTESPSRFSTKKPYQIQDAYGGDNYRGEWRPTTDIPVYEDYNETLVNHTTTAKVIINWDRPSFGKFSPSGSCKLVISQFSVVLSLMIFNVT